MPGITKARWRWERDVLSDLLDFEVKRELHADAAATMLSSSDADTND